MRRIIIGALLLTAFGCSKSGDTKCYTCKQLLEKKEGPVIRDSSSSTVTYCDKSAAEITAMEQANTYTKTENGITTTSSCQCSIK